MNLETVADCLLQIRAVIATQRELLPILHDDAILAVKPRLHLLDPIDLHDRRTMNPEELFRIELLFQTADRLAQQVTFLIVVDANRSEERRVGKECRALWEL